MKRIFLAAMVFFALASFAEAKILKIDYSVNGKGVTCVTYRFEKCDNPWKIYKMFFPGEVDEEKVKEKILVPNAITNPRRIPVGEVVMFHGEELNYLIPQNLIVTKEEIQEEKQADKGSQVNNTQVKLETIKRFDELTLRIKELEGNIKKNQEAILSAISNIRAEESDYYSFRLADIIIISLLLALIILQILGIRGDRDKYVVRSLPMLALVLLLFMGCAGPKMVMQDVNTGVSQANIQHSMLIQPHQSLGLEPTPAIREGKISTYLVAFPLRLFGEYYPGRLRWNAWVIQPSGTETFGQVIFSGVHPSGEYFGTMVIDGQVSTGLAAILSSAVDFLYSPLGKELAVEREKFLADSAYRLEKIREVNSDKNGHVFDLSRLSRVDDFQDVIKSWNQVKYPEGYLLSPAGVEEVAAIRGINPQYSYFQKLVGTGRFRVSPIPNPVGFAISNSLGLAIDLIGAGNAPTTGWDYNSQIPQRRNMAFIIEYLLTLAKKEIQLRNDFNLKLLRR